jgi:hypothetical protein
MMMMMIMMIATISYNWRKKYRKKELNEKV